MVYVALVLFVAVVLEGIWCARAYLLAVRADADAARLARDSLCPPAWAHVEPAEARPWPPRSGLSDVRYAIGGDRRLNPEPSAAYRAAQAEHVQRLVARQERQMTRVARKMN